MSDFDEGLWNELVEKVTVNARQNLKYKNITNVDFVFLFKNGEEVTI